MSYPAWWSFLNHRFPLPPQPKRGSGRSFSGYHGWLPPLFKTSVEVAVNNKTTVGELKILSKFSLISPHKKHLREELYAGTGKTSFSLFRNSHSSTALKKRNRTAAASSSFYFRSSGSNPERLNPLALIGRTPVCRKPSLKSHA